MLKFLKSFLFSFVVVALPILAHAQLPIAGLQTGQQPRPSQPDLAAKSFVLIDADSGRILAEKNASIQYPPASLTKLMTSYILAYELGRGNVNKSDQVLVSEKAWRTPGSRMFIREGTQVRLSDLLKGILIQSGNDASVAVAEHIAGSESAFADLMNQHAAILGMKNSRFQNATGLPADGHYSSALDMAVLARAIIKQYPEHYGIYSEKYFTYNDIRQANRNKLLWRDSSVDGMKTGHTEEAGYCLVASAKRDGMRLISVVMGTRSDEARAQESQKLLAYGYRYFRTHKLYDAGQVLDEIDIWAAQKDQLKVGLAEPLIVTIPRGQVNSLQAQMDLIPEVKGPITAGEDVGRVIVKLGNEVVADVPLVALESVAEAGLLTRIWHSILLFFTGLIG